MSKMKFVNSIVSFDECGRELRADVSEAHARLQCLVIVTNGVGVAIHEVPQVIEAAEALFAFVTGARQPDTEAE